MEMGGCWHRSCNKNNRLDVRGHGKLDKPDKWAGELDP